MCGVRGCGCDIDEMLGAGNILPCWICSVGGIFTRDFVDVVVGSVGEWEVGDGG